MRRDHRRSLLTKTANSVILTGEANGAATLSKSHAAGRCFVMLGISG